MGAKQVTSIAVALFAKAPKPGHVKTRLQPPLTPEEAAALHWAFSADSWERLQLLPGVAAYFYTDELWDAGLQLPGKPEARLQRGDDLGARMFHCLEYLHLAGHQLGMIVGGDSPSLPMDYLLQGFQLLRECDAVLGPSGDGGYYAVGCRSPRAGMFRDVSWSTPSTFDETLAAFKRAGLLTRLMPAWYDVDTPSDLQRMAEEPQLPRHTHAWIDAHAARVAPRAALPSQSVSSRKS
jgi:rSAM/selenodomain-associated transferase 1